MQAHLRISPFVSIRAHLQMGVSLSDFVNFSTRPSLCKFLVSSVGS